MNEENKKTQEEIVSDAKKEVLSPSTQGISMNDSELKETLKKSDEPAVKFATKMVDGKKVRIKTKKMVRELWKLFCDTYEEDFKAYMGYGKDEIKKVGVEKFFDFTDWCSEDDIKKFKQDTLKIVVCPVCKKEYAVFPSEYGICKKCLKKYDTEKLELYLSSLKDEGQILDMLTLFAFDKEVRNTFLIDTKGKKK